MNREMAILFHQYLHKLDTIKSDNYTSFFTWIEHFLMRDFSMGFWVEVIKVLASCDELDTCCRGLFYSLRQCGLDAELVAKFDELFARGLAEHVSLAVQSHDQVDRVFRALFDGHNQLMSLYHEYYPLGSTSSTVVPSLLNLTRWHIRRKLLKEDYIVFESELPLHVYTILNHYRT